MENQLESDVFLWYEITYSLQTATNKESRIVEIFDTSFTYEVGLATYRVGYFVRNGQIRIPWCDAEEID